MKHFFILTALLASLCVPASAQFEGGGGFGTPGFTSPAASGGGGSPTWTGTGAFANGSCSFAPSCTITTTATVTAGIVVAMAGVQNQGLSAGTISISICGTSLTMDVTPSITSGTYGGAMGHGSVTGGTCTITLTVSGTANIASAGVAFGTLNNLSSSTPGTPCSEFYNVSQSSPYPCTGGLTVAASGFGIIGYFDNQTTVPTSPGNIIVDANAQNSGGSAANVSIGHVTANCTAAQCEYAAASFAQASVIGEPFR